MVENTDDMKLDSIFEVLKSDYSFFKKHQNNFKKLQKSINKKDPLLIIVMPLIIFVNHTLRSISILYKNNCTKDCLVLSRHFIETVINIGFICATKEKSLKKNITYSIQRRFRDKKRELKINSKLMSLIHGDESFLKKLGEVDIMKNALNEYTNNHGKEINQWTKETIKEKIEVIDKKYGNYVGDILTFAFFDIYRDSSEVIHGSYYGFLVVTGLVERPHNSFKTAEELRNFLTKNETGSMKLIFVLLSMSIVALMIILNEELNLEFDIEKCKNLLLDYADLEMLKKQ
ncbi:MAG: DUF5677 domain-containing protein [Ignavibacteriaceae bacterium]|nr:DUF5677 domain-containing protein [Ignavibacteriaceae bacterium]